LVDQLRVSQTFGDIMLYIRVVFGRARLDPLGLVKPRDEEDERQGADDRGQGQPVAQFHAASRAAPGCARRLLGDDLMPKSPSRKKPKNYLAPAFWATSPARRPPRRGECDLPSSQASRSKLGRLTCIPPADRPRPSPSRSLRC